MDLMRKMHLRICWNVMCGIHQGKKCRIRWYNAPNAESTAIVSEVKVLNVY